MADIKAGGPHTLIDRIPATLVIAGGSAASYALAHIYESAYLTYFAVPRSFVHVSTSTILAAAGAILSVLWGAYTVAKVVTSLARPVASDANLSFVLTVTLFRGFAAALTSWRDWRRYSWDLGVAVLMIGIAVLLQWWIPKLAAQGKLRIPPSQAQQQEDSYLPSIYMPTAVARALMPWIGKEGLIIMFVFFQAQGVAADIGRAAARDETEFLTLSGHPGFVAVRSYDDSIVAVSFDRMAHEVGPDMLILSPSKDGAVPLRRESLGRLRPASDKQSVQVPTASLSAVGPPGFASGACSAPTLRATRQGMDASTPLSAKKGRPESSGIR